MKSTQTTGAQRRGGILAMVSTIALGLAVWTWVWMTPDGHGLERWSYDGLFLFKPRQSPGEVVVVTMDERAYRALGQEWGKMWPRGLHARLLDKLTADRARLVVFDILFSDPGQAQDNAALAQAMRTNGRVVLAGVLAPLSQSGLTGDSVQTPRTEFLTNAVAWGISVIRPDPDQVVRKIEPGTEDEPSLAWVAAREVGASVASDPGRRMAERWLNYYGGPDSTLRRISYADALEQPEGYFRDKIVVVGGRPQTRTSGEEVDEFPTPWTWTRQEKRFIGGVEIVATSILNLLRQDWLRRMPGTLEGLLLVASGALLGFGLSRFSPLTGLGISALALGAVIASSAVLVWTTQVWWVWGVVAFVQIPCAWICSALARQKQVAIESDFLQRTLDETMSEIKKAVPASALTILSTGQTPIPDHELVRRIGQGAYGEVWLARNAVGIFHAVKIVRRDKFSDSAPYEREFKGIQKYMPVSRTHPGLVHILHVGRVDATGYFFYIMEVADDTTLGNRIDVQTYQPRSLATDLDKQRVLPVQTCVTLMLALTGALDHLHRQQLVHRDIKPSNIIFIDGVPKFADIGLVTDLASTDHRVSIVGTRGYIPPEGPGTASADVYSLGKVLYQASTGMDPELFPELPTDFGDRPDYAQFKALNPVLGQACDSDPRRRFRNAVEFHTALLRLQFQAANNSL